MFAISRNGQSYTTQNINAEKSVTTQPGNAAHKFIMKNILNVTGSHITTPRVNQAQPRVDSWLNGKGAAPEQSVVERLNAVIKLADGEVFPKP